jgi:peroxiredoxin
MVSNIAVDELAPDFGLKDLKGSEHRLVDHRGKTVVLDFWSADCPWSSRSDEVIAGLEAGWRQDKEVILWRIASNANEDEEQLSRAEDERHVGTVLLDSDQAVADLYGAVTTPHIYVIDSQGKLRYQGAFDDTTWREPEASRNYLAEAVSAVLIGTAPEVTETLARGCTIVRYPLKG